MSCGLISDLAVTHAHAPMWTWPGAWGNYEAESEDHELFCPVGPGSAGARSEIAFPPGSSMTSDHLLSLKQAPQPRVLEDMALLSPTRRGPKRRDVSPPGTTAMGA